MDAAAATPSTGQRIRDWLGPRMWGAGEQGATLAPRGFGDQVKLGDLLGTYRGPGREGVIAAFERAKLVQEGTAEALGRTAAQGTDEALLAGQQAATAQPAFRMMDFPVAWQPAADDVAAAGAGLADDAAVAAGGIADDTATVQRFVAEAMEQLGLADDMVARTSVLGHAVDAHAAATGTDLAVDLVARSGVRGLEPASELLAGRLAMAPPAQAMEALSAGMHAFEGAGDDAAHAVVDLVRHAGDDLGAVAAGSVDDVAKVAAASADDIARVAATGAADDVARGVVQLATSGRRVPLEQGIQEALQLLARWG